MNTWYLIVARDGARVVEVAVPRAIPHIVKEFENHDGKKHAKDLESDRPGRSQARGSEVKHALGQQVSARDHQLEKFIRGVEEFLQEKHRDKAFSELVLVADPRMIGEMRSIFGEALMHLVKKEIPKNLYHLGSVQELQPALGL